jgi:hypothetical protein
MWDNGIRRAGVWRMRKLLSASLRGPSGSRLAIVLGLGLAACAGTSGDDVGDGAQDVLAVGAHPGRQTIHFAVDTQGAPDETCILPNHIPGADYSDSDTKSEQTLCSYSFYSTGPREAGVPKADVAICPKLDSTNPGVDIQDLIQGQSREATEAKICKETDRETKKLAKFKQSITCSYAPSIIGYYHLSRALGGAGDVKPVVARTMDLQEHRKITGEALQILGGQADNSFPKVSWLSYRSAEANPSTTRLKDQLFTSDLMQIYGGLQENPRGEAKYSELNRRGADPHPWSLFVQTPGFQHVADGRPLEQIAPRKIDQAQTIVQMEDITELLVMDYLMSQQDRFGNVHEIDYFYFPKAGGGVDKVKKSKVVDNEVAMPAGAVPVKKMMLKDNDCGGPQKTNNVKNAGLADQMRHMNPKTYANLRWLAANFGPNTDIPKLFASEALFVQADVDMLRKNLGDLSTKLHTACTSGRLLLDLDLSDHLAGKSHDPASCEGLAPPKPVTP